MNETHVVTMTPEERNDLINALSTTIATMRKSHNKDVLTCLLNTLSKSPSTTKNLPST